MKKIIFTLLLLSTIGFISCRKDKVQPGIETVDNQQILSYISNHSITGMVRDTVGGDTSGIYYKVMLPGLPGTSYKYTDSISFVYSLASFDGQYTSVDTVANHYASYAGHITLINLPLGLQLIVHDVLKRGGALRVLIPSHLAYGVAGSGSGSVSNANSHIAGNQCLDYYIHAINNEAAYDDLVIKNYLAYNNVTGYQKTADGIYYIIHTPGTGTDPITFNTTVTSTYTAYLLNNYSQINATIINQYNTADGSGTPQEFETYIPGLQEGLSKFITTGAYVSFYIPSTLAYGASAAVSGVPANSCLHYDIRVVSVAP